MVVYGIVAAVWAAAADLFPIGFVSHYPMVRYADERVRETGAHVMEVRAPWPLLEPEEGRFEFGLLDEQLRWAEQQGLKLVYILEAGPAHAAGVPWLMKKLKQRGETTVDLEGNGCGEPSLFSATYRQYLARYLERTVEYLTSHPLREVVYGYNNGCEWWWPLGQSYGPLAAAAFRQYLRARYDSVGVLNGVWGACFGGWEEVQPPRVIFEGVGEQAQGFLLPASCVLDACYCTTEEAHVRVRPGQRLVFTVEYSGPDGAPKVAQLAPPGGGVSVEIAWLDGEHPQPVKLDRAAAPASSGRLRLEAVAPASAAQAWLLMKSHARGRVIFTGVSCREEGGRELAPNPGLDPAEGGWQFIAWSAGEPEQVSHGWSEPGAAWIEYRPRGRLGSGSEWPLVEVYDWLDFRARAVSEFMDWMAARINEADPTRPVISYLTFSFANPFEWDYAQQMGISLDHHVRAGGHEAVVGMQLAAAEGDYDSVTCALDVVRKYGKPMWAIDLLDFTRGVALGPSGLTRVSLSVVQHGGSGIQYYCWFGTPHYNYGELGTAALREMIGAVQRQAAMVGGGAPVREVALVMPRMPLYGLAPEPINDWRDFMGWYKFLVRCGVCPDVYTLEELSGAELAGYQAVVVPDCAYISEGALQALGKGARQGVGIVTSGRFAGRDLTGRPLSGAAGVPLARAFGEPVGARVLGEVYRCKTPTDTPPRLVCREESPRWGRREVTEMVRCLQDLGVTVACRPGTWPVTVSAWRRGAHRLAFVLPDSGWSGTVRVGGCECQVGPAGSLCIVRSAPSRRQRQR